MSRFAVHTKDSAPAESAQLLESAEQAFGFIPNLLGVFAESPATLEGYLSLSQLVDKSSLSPVERQVAILAISRFNECHYCVAAHSVIADTQGASDDVVDAIRNDRPIDDARLEALRTFARRVVEKRGWVAEHEIAEVQSAGFTNAQVLEVVLAAAMKTLSNYVNHLAETPLDDAFSSRAWEPRKQHATG